MPAVTIGTVAFAASPNYTSGAQWCEEFTNRAPQVLMRTFGAPGVNGQGVKIGGFRSRPMLAQVTFVRSSSAGADDAFDTLCGTLFTVTRDNATYENCRLVDAPIFADGVKIKATNGTALFVIKAQVLLDQVAKGGAGGGGYP